MPGAGYGKWSLSDARRRQHGSAHSEGPSAIPESKLEARSLFCRCKSREALVPRISGRLSNASVGRADCCHFTNDLLERSTTKSDSRLLRFYLFRGAWGSSPDIGPIPHPPVPHLQVPMSIGKKKAPLHTAHSETAAEKGGIVETSISDRVAWRYLHLRLDRA
jgi:hypothetical protein